MTDPDSAPLVSIVIPTFERPVDLERCLISIESAHRPNPIEVLVVDDGGSVQLEDIVAPFRSSIGAILVRRQNGGPGAARNTGVEHARGPLIVFIDDDCTFASESLATVARALRDTPGVIVGGRTRNLLTDNHYASMSQAIVDVVYAFHNPEPENARFFATNNMAMEREAFVALGGFDERFSLAAEDREFCDRWRHQGGRLVYNADIVINHAHDLTLATFVRQHVRYGFSAYAYHRVRAQRRSGRLRDDLRFHAQLPARLLGRKPRGSAVETVQAASLVGVWQLSNAAGCLGAAAVDGLSRIDGHRRNVLRRLCR